MDYTNLILDMSKDVLGPLDFVCDKDSEKIWKYYNRSWCLIAKVCGPTTSASKQTLMFNKHRDFFEPYFKALQKAMTSETGYCNYNLKEEI